MLSFPCQIGNPVIGNLVVDIMLGEKLGLGKAAGISTEVSLRLPKPCGIDDFDLCVIFANALDNAIHACQAVKGAKSIRISGEWQGDFYVILTSAKIFHFLGSIPASTSKTHCSRV